MARQKTPAKSFSRLSKDKGGNFAIATALILPVLLASGGVGIDMAHMFYNRTMLQDATDAAALAASSAMAGKGATQAQAKLIALSFLKAQMNSNSNTVESDPTKADPNAPPTDFDSTTQVIIEEKATTGTGKSFKVKVVGFYDHYFNPMTRLLGKQKVTLSAMSSSESATETKNALSMFLVLDRSGSMGEDTSTVAMNNTCYDWRGRSYSCPTYVSKIAALKLAVADLVTQLTIADPTRTYVRTGAVSYNLEEQPAVNLAWGTAGVMTYVNALTATGGTDSSDAFKTGYQKVGANTEEKAHKDKTGLVPTKYMILMTDGDNNYASADTDTKKWCDKARADGIQVYSVAFMAPDRGQKLLKYCATTDKNYFPADNAAELTAAFKYIGERASAMVSRLTN